MYKRQVYKCVFISIVRGWLLGGLINKISLGLLKDLSLLTRLGFSLGLSDLDLVVNNSNFLLLERGIEFYE